MKKMIFFLLVGGIAVFCQLHNHGGLLINAGILFGLIGIVMAVDKVKPLIEWLKERKAKKPTKEKEEEERRGPVGPGPEERGE